VRTQVAYVQHMRYVVAADPQNMNARNARWGAGVETQKNVRGEIGGWGRVPVNEPYTPYFDPQNMNAPECAGFFFSAEKIDYLVQGSHVKIHQSCL